MKLSELPEPIKAQLRERCLAGMKVPVLSLKDSDGDERAIWVLAEFARNTEVFRVNKRRFTRTMKRIQAGHREPGRPGVKPSTRKLYRVARAGGRVTVLPQ